MRARDLQRQRKRASEMYFWWRDVFAPQLQIQPANDEYIGTRLRRNHHGHTCSSRSNYLSNVYHPRHDSHFSVDTIRANAELAEIFTECQDHDREVRRSFWQPKWWEPDAQKAECPSWIPAREVWSPRWALCSPGLPLDWLQDSNQCIPTY